MGKWVAGAQLLIEWRTDPNALDHNGVSVLQHSTALLSYYKEAFPLVEKLIDAGVDLNRADKFGKTFLHELLQSLNKAGYDDPERLELFLRLLKKALDAGADPNRPDIFGETPLYYAIFFPPAFRLLLEKGADPKALGPGGRNLVYKVATYGALELLEDLKSHGLDFNHKDQKGLTPIFAYALESYGNYEFAGGAQAFIEGLRLLIQLGADPKAATEEGDGLLHAILKTWPTKRRTNKALLHSVLDFLVREAGLDPNGRNKEGQTPLHLAVKKGRWEAALLLAARGANPWLLDNEGKAPGDLAEDPDKIPSKVLKKGILPIKDKEALSALLLKEDIPPKVLACLFKNLVEQDPLFVLGILPQILSSKNSRAEAIKRALESVEKTSLVKLEGEPW